MELYRKKSYCYIGKFFINAEEFSGEITYNKEGGNIILKLVRQYKCGDTGKKFIDVEIINGELNVGGKVFLYKNECISRYIKMNDFIEVYFRCDYCIFGDSDQVVDNVKTLSFVVDNANAVVNEKYKPVTLERSNDFQDRYKYKWFGMDVLIRPYKKEERYLLSGITIKKNTIIITIKNDNKQKIDDFLLAQQKIMQLISFAIKDNINIGEAYLNNLDNYEEFNGEKIYAKYYFFISNRETIGRITSPNEVNFTLNQIPTDKDDIGEVLEKMIPIFNLYLSLFKYRDMPVEMFFLNVVQAIETYHSRFIGNNKKENRKKWIKNEYCIIESYKRYVKYLKSDKKQISLATRIYDLLTGENFLIFRNCWLNEKDYVQEIVDTRNYYTHYNLEKEHKVLSGKKLKDTIFYLRLLLEYYICQSLSINNYELIEKEMNDYNGLRKFKDTID